MNITRIKRPWQKQHNYGHRLHKDTFYQYPTWKRTKASFKLGFTEWNGQQVSNQLCLECFKQGITRKGYAIDHIVAIEDGGSRTDHTNLQNLCESHHNSKSAQEGNKRKHQ